MNKSETENYDNVSKLEPWRLAPLSGLAPGGSAFVCLPHFTLMPGQTLKHHVAYKDTVFNHAFR